MAKPPPPIIQTMKCRRLTTESLGNVDVKSNFNKKAMQGNCGCFSFSFVENCFKMHNLTYAFPLNLTFLQVSDIYQDKLMDY